MSVKDILTSLVDDGMVDTDKIGTSVYFWAFPGKARQKVFEKQYLLAYFMACLVRFLLHIHSTLSLVTNGKPWHWHSTLQYKVTG